MKIGILGCGYVGQEAALRWKNEGHNVTVTTRRPERIAQLKEYADNVLILNHQSFGSFIEQQEALLISVAPDSPSEYTSTYLETSKQVVVHFRNAPFLQHILYTSSTSLYGDHQGAWVNEETPIHDPDKNRKILFETEQNFLSCSSPDVCVSILRLGEIYGPGREIEERIRRSHKTPFPGNGESYTNLNHIEDIVGGLNFALLHKLQGVYNLCNDFHITRKEFYEKICLQENIPPIQWDPAHKSQHGGNRRVSNQKIKDAGFVFTHPDFFLT